MKLHMHFEFPEEPTKEQAEFVKEKFREEAFTLAKLIWPNKSFNVEFMVDAPDKVVRTDVDLPTLVREYEFVTKIDAKAVLGAMKGIIKRFGSVTLCDLHDLMGIPSHRADMNFGWTTTDGMKIIKNGQTWSLVTPQFKNLHD